MDKVYRNFESCITQPENIIVNLMYPVRVASFSFITNHGLVLLSIAEDPHVRMRDIATTVDITEPYWRMIKTGAIDEKEIADCLQPS